MPTPRADLLDPAAVAALGSLELVSRWVVDGFLSGLHRSPRKGFSVEFAEYRPYQPGDDLRYLDWRIAARADRWVIRQYEEETNARAALVLDATASMRWRGADTRLTKLAYAEQLLGALAHLLLRQRDAVGLVRVDTTVRAIVPPRSRRGQWWRMAAALREDDVPAAPFEPRRAARDTPDRGTAELPGQDLVAGLQQAARLVRRPGFIVIVSDLLMERAPVLEQLRALRARGHEVLVLQVLDPAERDFVEGGAAHFTDPEDPATSVAADPAEVRAAYRAAIRAEVGAWRDAILRLGARHTVALTDQPFGVPMRAIVRASGAGAMPIA